MSALALQFVNDLPGALVQIRRALKPDGLFLAALLGGDTLTELRQAFAAAESEMEGGLSPRVAPFADIRDLGALLQRADFALPVVDSERVTVRYDSAVRADARSAARWARPMSLHERRACRSSARRWPRMAEIYGERFADPDGRMRATFEIVWLSGWAPHESQQQPLKPGSARARGLADALGTTELPARRENRSAGTPGDHRVEPSSSRVRKRADRTLVAGQRRSTPSGERQRVSAGRTSRGASLAFESPADASPPSAGRHRAASGGESPDRRGSRR